MNSRKLLMTTTAIVLLFLFITGTVVLSHLNTNITSASTDEKGKNSALGGIFDSISNNLKPVNILVLGGDKVNGNTDTIMLVNYDPSTTKANIVSIPRDTKVIIDEKKRKINFAYPQGGAKLAIETVSQLLGVNIKYYIYIDTSVFRKIIDRLGGINDFYVPANMDYDDPVQDLHIHLKKGIQDLDGKKAEQFMRFRHPNGRFSKELRQYYDGSDLKRIDAQQTLIKELVRQKANLFYIHKVNDVLQDVFDSLETNMLLGDALNLFQNIQNFKYENISFHTLPGSPVEEEYSYYSVDMQAARDLATQYFGSEETFAGMTAVSGIDPKYSNPDNSKYDQSVQKKDYKKNNPSNSKSNIKKDTKPKP